MAHPRVAAAVCGSVTAFATMIVLSCQHRSFPSGITHDIIVQLMCLLYFLQYCGILGVGFLTGMGEGMRTTRWQDMWSIMMGGKRTC